jgi:K+-sensing histidine kinase KdpD
VVNHELRTPLTSIKGFATTLLADDVVWSRENQIDFIQTINEEADKLSNLIEQMLDLSKMNASKTIAECVEQPLDAVLAPIMAQLHALTGRHTLVIDIPETLPPVMADTQRCGQVLVNLVENATKYSPLKTQITISARVDGDFMKISVADQGPGIASQDMKKVFQPFYRSEDPKTSKSKGAGLGMYICQRLVEAQGGRIWIQEHEGPGAIIAFTLPIATASERKIQEV